MNLAPSVWKPLAKVIPGVSLGYPFSLTAPSQPLQTLPFLLAYFHRLPDLGIVVYFVMVSPPL